ncbi:ISCps9 transposase [Centipeda periodontii DSM 2778]|uniref:ISCps9 transposase n=1 Tax=Centipeda periodontii DSM 2778 TaxID=888060 RepID=F5RNA9_9FIRM|nr:IS3 family transposase [Centipeda periodontii]EGK59175.1 ISCps9 transposase [Centipeda periodontii DSM 2778]
MKFIAFKTADGAHKGNISFYCRLLHVTRQGFYQYLVSKDRPWKYQELADAMMQIHAEDECNDTYGRIRMYQALKIKQPEGIHVPSERTVYRIMEEIGLSHRPTISRTVSQKQIGRHRSRRISYTVIFMPTHRFPSVSLT